MQEKFKPLAKTRNTGRAMVGGPTNPSIEDRFMGEKASRTIHWRHHVSRGLFCARLGRRSLRIDEFEPRFGNLTDLRSAAALAALYRVTAPDPETAGMK